MFPMSASTRSLSGTAVTDLTHINYTILLRLVASGVLWFLTCKAAGASSHTDIQDGPGTGVPGTGEKGAGAAGLYGCASTSGNVSTHGIRPGQSGTDNCPNTVIADRGIILQEGYGFTVDSNAIPGRIGSRHPVCLELDNEPIPHGVPRLLSRRPLRPRIAPRRCPGRRESIRTSLEGGPTGGH